jgi:hypothetical protein
VASARPSGLWLLGWIVSDDDAGGFAPPPFNPANALQQLQRSLRDLRLAPRGNAFELRGRRVVELAEDGAVLQARLARKLALTPEFDKLTVASAADQRKLIDEVRKRLARWEQED